MTADPKGRGLFIVDNSVSGWTGLRYLEEWAGIAAETSSDFGTTSRSKTTPSGLSPLCVTCSNARE